MPVEMYRHGTTLVAHGATWDFNTRLVREDFQEEYRKNPVLADRDFGAQPPKASQSALPDPDIIERLANKERISPVKEDGSYHEWFRGDPTKEYFLHIDMSKANDATGIGMCHYDVLQDKICTDLIQTLEASSDWKLSFERIYNLILFYKQMGFNLKKVTFDSWQSFYMLERLINAGIPAEIYSCDKGTEAYDTLISTILLNKLDYYYQPVFIKELKEIKLIGGVKYDHPQDGSKDTSDGVAGCVTNCAKAHTGLALVDQEVEKAVHEEHFLDLEEHDLSEGGTYWAVTTKMVTNMERVRRRVARIDATDRELIFVLGYHDKEKQQLFVDEYLIWENFTDEMSVTKFTQFIDELSQHVTISAVSANDQVPLDIISHLKNSGRHVSTPLASRSRRQRGTTRSAGVSDTTLRQMVSQLKKGAISIPRVDQLIRDLKFMTSTNQKERVFSCALAGWADFSSREMTFGNSSTSLARPISSAAAPINNQASRGQAQPMGRGGGDIEAIRARYSSYNKVAPTITKPGSGQRSLPKPIRGG